MTDTFVLKLTWEQVADLIGDSEEHDLLVQVTKQCAGDLLDDWPVSSWLQHWPIIDADKRLTGEFTDAQSVGHNFASYNDTAMIDIDVAVAGGWTVDNGVANPPEDDD